MELIGSRDQSRIPLDVFYRELAEDTDPLWSICGRTMLDLIARLRALPEPWRAYGLTSHAVLCLMAEDSWQSDKLLKISVLDDCNIDVEYRMPDHLAPWPHAYVKGWARSIDEAIEMVRIGMARCEGWGH